MRPSSTHVNRIRRIAWLLLLSGSTATVAAGAAIGRLHPPPSVSSHPEPKAVSRVLDLTLRTRYLAPGRKARNARNARADCLTRILGTHLATTSLTPVCTQAWQVLPRLAGFSARYMKEAEG